MQEIVSDGITSVELIPGSVLHAKTVSGGSYAVLRLQSKEGNTQFSGASTTATGEASAGPFPGTTVIQVEVKGKVALYVDTPNSLRQDATTGALTAADGSPINLGSYGLSGVTYDGSNRVTGFVLDGVTYTFTGWGTSTVTITGSNGNTRRISLDGSGRFVGVN